MQLKQKIVAGLGWNLTGSLFTQLINFGTKVVTARLLLPADFGLFAMAFIFINFLNSFIGLGIMSALIARKEDSALAWQTGFTLSILLGILFSLLGFLFSGIISSFFQQPALQPMIQVLSLVFLFDSISTTLIGSLVKDLAFQRKIIAELTSILCYGILIIGFALAGYGVWSIVLAYVIQHALLTLFLWIACLRKPSLGFDRAIAWELLHFGKYIIGTSFFAWAITTIDNIVVGRQLKEEQLGYYSLGFTIATLPVLSITHIMTSVFHPVYAKLQDDKERLRIAYLKPLAWSLLFMFPFAAGMFLLAKPFVIVVFGDKWLSLIPLLKIFSLYCIFRTIVTISSQLLEAIGKPKEATTLLAIELALVVIILIPAIHWLGIIGAAAAVVFSRGISVVLFLYRVRHFVPFTFTELMEQTQYKMLSTCCMMIVLYFSLKLSPFQEGLFSLLFFIFLGFFVYTIFLFFTERTLFREAKLLIIKQAD